MKHDTTLIERGREVIASMFGMQHELTEYEQCLIEHRSIGICAHLLKKE